MVTRPCERGIVFITWNVLLGKKKGGKKKKFFFFFFLFPQGRACLVLRPPRTFRPCRCLSLPILGPLSPIFAGVHEASSSPAFSSRPEGVSTFRHPTSAVAWAVLFFFAHRPRSLMSAWLHIRSLAPFCTGVHNPFIIGPR